MMDSYNQERYMVNTAKSFKSRVINSSMWTLGGYAWAQLARLASNVILAKLLFPEAFGLMMLVAVFIQGIGMFSDIGTGQSIIQNKRGDEPNFLNTAWTLQIIRGFAIWIIACLGASTYAKIYGEPALAILLPVAALEALIAGFNSTALSTANRKLNLKKITIMGFITQGTSISVMITWVLIYPTVWGLVAGGLARAVVRMLLSHLWFGGFKNRIHIEPLAAKQMFRFGKWIFFSTALTFFTMQIDRLLFGYLMGTSMLGVYSIAAMFTMVSQSAIQMLSSKVLFPSYAEIIREGDDKKLYKILAKTRLIMIAGTWLLSIILITLGAQLISILYDERYNDAIWMIQILPLGALLGVLSLTYQDAMLAKGRSLYITIIMVIQLLIQITGITIGYQLSGITGIIIGYSMVGWILYPFTAIFAKKINIWQPKIDFPVIFLAIIFVTAYSNFIAFV
jgi:O-antigen/teichoic acid export membrane protein